MRQKISYQIRPYPYMNKKTGKNSFGLQIIINGSPRMLPIEVSWYKKDFDTNKELFITNENQFEELNDLNLTIGKEKALANDIITRYRHNNRALTHQLFKIEFNWGTSASNVHEFLKTKSKELLKEGDFEESSLPPQINVFKRLAQFHDKPLPFNEVDTGFLLRFEKFLRGKGYKHNTIVQTHKVLKKYFRIAADLGLMIYPYKKGKTKSNFVAGDREALNLEELQRLIALFADKEKLSDTLLTTLEMYVFSATSGGYRFSELQMLTSDHIKNGRLKMETLKGRRYGIELDIKLPEIGLKMIEGRTGKIFNKISEQTARKRLKTLAEMAEINKNVKFHSSRDTFCTLYIYFGGSLITLSKDVVKHSKIETTMIYQKKSDEMVNEEMKNFDRFEMPTFDKI